MALYDYTGTSKQDRKQYQVPIQKDEYSYLPALDDMLSYTEIVSEVNLRTIDIPLERIMGTRTKGRANASTNNFMPPLNEKSESRIKWAYPYNHQIEEGIHDPITAYEFMNQFYIQKGNKGVSVLRYLNALSISDQATRLIPGRSDDEDTGLHYEFLDFYQVLFNYDVWFSKEGSYARFLEAMGKRPDQVRSGEEREYLKAAYDRFSEVFSTNDGNAVDLACSDAFLVYAEIFGYGQVKERIRSEIQKDLVKIKSEILPAASDSKIALAEKPEEVDDGLARGKSWFLPSMSQEPKDMKVVFTHARAAGTPNWTYGHEPGRNYLEQAFGGNMQTSMFDKADTEKEMMADIDLVITAGYDVIFTTASPMTNPSLKAAIRHPGVKIFNCSVNMSYSFVCTCYGRMYESEFLMGAIVASMAQLDRLGYIADYPILGTIANISASVLGVRMISPCMEVYLEWSRLKNVRGQETLQEGRISYISGEDIITPRTVSRECSLHHKKRDGTCVDLATPILHWGKFYERIVKVISHDSSELKGMRGKQAVNYWWGTSADVIDVICPRNLSRGTDRLISFLRSSIRTDNFRPFDGLIYSQGEVVQRKEDESLSPQEIITMDWLAENVVGRTPDFDELVPEAQSPMRLQGVKPDDNEDAEGKQTEDIGSGGQ